MLAERAASEGPRSTQGQAAVYDFGTGKLRESITLAYQGSHHAGCSKRPSSKAAGESKPEEVPTALRGRPYKLILANGKTPPVIPPSETLNWYVEDFDEPRTPLAVFFSILLRSGEKFFRQFRGTLDFHL